MVTKKYSKQHNKVYNSLVEIYMHLADAIDGGKRVPNDVKNIYHETLKLPHMQKFYEKLVDQRQNGLLY